MDTRQQKNPTVSTDDWYTPKWIIDTLGPFDLDPCAPPADVRPYEIAPTAYTKDDDGLSHEWYCTSRQPRMAWRIDMVDAEGLIVRKLVHDMREHTISKAPEIYKPETVEQLAKKIIDYNFRFLDDFDRKEWD